MQNVWNISKIDAETKIFETIDYLFFINNKNTLTIQYIRMNLSYYIKKIYNIIFKKNNKIRNVNNYIKLIYKSFILLLLKNNKYNISIDRLYLSIKC